MTTIQQVREMTDEQIMAEMRKIAAATIGMPTVEQTVEQSMYYTVMAQRKNIDPKPKIQAAGYGVYEKAVSEGWF
jgi:flavorubredoxin